MIRVSDESVTSALVSYNEIPMGYTAIDISQKFIASNFDRWKNLQIAQIGKGKL